MTNSQGYYTYVPRIRSENRERKREIQEKGRETERQLSPPLDPAMVSALGLVLRWRVHATWLFAIVSFIV